MPCSHQDLRDPGRPHQRAPGDGAGGSQGYSANACVATCRGDMSPYGVS